MASKYNYPYLSLHARRKVQHGSFILFPLMKSQTSIGRGPGNNISLPDTWTFVSRHQCVLSLMKDRKCFLKRLAKNKISVNSEFLLQGHTRELKDKDEIYFHGPGSEDMVRLVFHSNADRPKVPANASRPTVPANAGRPTVPANAGRPTVPANAGRPTVPANAGRPTVPANAGRPTAPANAGRPTAPANAGRPTYPANAGRPTVPAKAGRPTVPANAGRPTGPVNAGRPMVPAKAGRPVGPSKASRPMVPSKGQRPKFPSVAERPLVPSKGQHPMVSSQNQRPVVPSKCQHPMVPSKGQHPMVPSKGQHHMVPSKGQHPMVPSKGQYPTVPSTAERPMVPSKRQRPVVSSRNQRAMVPSQNQRPVVSSQNQRPMVPSKGQRPVAPSTAERRMDPADRGYDGSEKLLMCQNWVNSLDFDVEMKSNVREVVKPPKLNRSDFQLCQNDNLLDKSPEEILKMDRDMPLFVKQVKRNCKRFTQGDDDLKLEAAVEKCWNEYQRKRKIYDNWAEQFKKGNLHCGMCYNALDQVDVHKYGYEFCKNCLRRRNGRARKHATSSSATEVPKHD